MEDQPLKISGAIFKLASSYLEWKIDNNNNKVLKYTYSLVIHCEDQEKKHA